MRKLLIAMTIGLSVISSTASAGSDPCKSIICLAGMLTGDTDSECNDAIKSYFDIQVWKKGKFKASKTLDARKSFLNSCPADDGGYKDKINGKWGQSLGF